MNNQGKHPMMSKWRTRALALALLVGTPALVAAQNAIQSINSTPASGCRGGSN